MYYVCVSRYKPLCTSFLIKCHRVYTLVRQSVQVQVFFFSRNMPWFSKKDSERKFAVFVLFCYSIFSSIYLYRWKVYLAILKIDHFSSTLLYLMNSANLSIWASPFQFLEYHPFYSS